jgi:lipopolysaccharide/colanic/teichoic acid biosynthesis glycosyltransferase
MISAREKGFFQLLLVAQLGVISLLYWACFLILFSGPDLTFGFAQAYVKYWVIVMLAMIFEGLSRHGSLRPVPGRMRRMAPAVSRRQWVWVLASLTCLLVFSRDLRISRIFLGVFAVSSLATLYLSNIYLLRWLANRFSDYLVKLRLRTVILGPSHWCDSILPEVKLLQSMVEVTRVERTNGNDLSSEDYANMVNQEPIDLLILPPRHFPDKIVIDFLRLGDRLGFRCWLPIELTRKYGRRFDLQKVGCLDVLSPPVEPLENTSNQVIKRLFDMLFSFLVAVTLLPILCGIVFVIHRLYSPGPLFFKQRRVGKNGIGFEVYKFRTMQVYHGDEAQQATKGDRRIFKGGRFLRRSSIDEIPQFINVLKGDMSVVGPRPHMEEHDVEFQEIFERYGLRRYVKPGVTGLAQVKGFRGEICKPQDLRNRARLDNFYVTHWDVGLDIGIVMMTVVSTIRPPKTAY